MIRTVEEDPRDLTGARKYLGVYLMGARDATIKFVDLYARNKDADARADYEALLDDLEQNFAARTDKMLLDDRSDMDIEINVLRDRLQREGVSLITVKGTNMSDTIRQKAEATLAEVEKITAVVLPEPKSELITLDAGRCAHQRRNSKAHRRDRHRQTPIRSCPSARPHRPNCRSSANPCWPACATRMLAQPGTACAISSPRSAAFQCSELDVRRERSWWEKLLGRAAPMAKFAARFEEVQGQIDKITDDLLRHEHVLLKDIESLDMLYDKTLHFYDELALYIAAGEAKID